jgi:hypothetical protein
MASADIWADPSCPWSYLTANWLLEVERVRDVTVSFHVMSLSVLNENTVASAAEQDGRARAWGPVRVLTAASLTLGQRPLRDLYLALSTLIHRERRRLFDRDFYALALTRAGLPYSLAYAAESPHYDDAVRESHNSRAAPGEEALGSPTVKVHRASGESVAFYGPVISAYPRGEAAGRLWDSLWLAANTESFFELKRIRTVAPTFD